VFARHSRWKTMREWRALGLAPKSGVWPGDDVLASLLEPDGEGENRLPANRKLSSYPRLQLLELLRSVRRTSCR
jgi:hypothetical protein